MFAKRPGKPTMIALLAWLLLSLGGSRISCAPDNSTDVLALQDFKNEISDPTGVLDSWNSTVSHCMWKGVRCNPGHPGRVVALELPGLGLAGQISPSVGNLTFLKMLNLSANSLSGQLPPFNYLHKLQILDLSSNSLHDNIPDALANCSKLRELHLRKNSLFGEIPSKLGWLSNLSVLRISYNNLTGTIPPTLSNITNIGTINLASNFLTGSIPDEFEKIADISMLALGVNNLHADKFPRALYNMSTLEILGLEFNEFEMTLPDNIGDHLPNLQILLLNRNKFHGQIPASLGNASDIYRLEFENNNFTGFPSSFGKLQNLQYLNIENNSLGASNRQSWESFDALTNCSQLQLLSLSLNQLYGVIPNSLGNFTSLERLILSENKLFGVVPPSIRNLGSLIQLSLDSNYHLSGSIEEWIGQLTQLQVLELQYNNFTGPISTSIGNLTYLTRLILENNEFGGPVPPSLGKLGQLQLLYFAYNNFQGIIPQEISNLNQLSEIDLSSNKLTGEIPNNLNQCPNLVIVQMGNNFLIGTIPASIGNITGLSILNLSRNNLTGEIPTALNALQLSKLDLSYNDLQGEIPRNGVFNNATVISLEGNLGLCGGSVDLHMPPCTPVSHKAASQYYVIRVLIPVFGFMSVILLFHFTFLDKKAPNRTYLMLHSFGKKFPKVSYRDLAQATLNFSDSNILGRGSYGSVYKGKLAQSKTEVAIKVFDLEMRCAQKSFISECEVLRSIKHRNLLPILTACSTIDNIGNAFRALVYEFMPNGNLDTWLHHKSEGQTQKGFGLAQRISIAVDIVDGLVYLHNDIEIPIVHCDLKPSNILLDANMKAYLGDFGIANLVYSSRSKSIGHPNSNTSTVLKGTIGYIAPEYAHSGQVSTQGDVYSFGIVLLQMLLGRRPTDSMFENGLTIVTFAERKFPDEILEIIDPRLFEECEGFIQATREAENVVHDCFLSLVQVAISCTRLSPRERINMREVATKLQLIRTSYAVARRKQVTHIQ